MDKRKDVNTDALIEEMLVTCIEAEFWIAGDLWLGAGVKCPHGEWRTESPSLALSGAIVELHIQFMVTDHSEDEDETVDADTKRLIDVAAGQSSSLRYQTPCRESRHLHQLLPEQPLVQLLQRLYQTLLTSFLLLLHLYFFQGRVSFIL